MMPPRDPEPINFPDESFENILRRLSRVPAPKKEEKAKPKAEKPPTKRKK